MFVKSMQLFWLYHLSSRILLSFGFENLEEEEVLLNQKLINSVFNEFCSYVILNKSLIQKILFLKITDGLLSLAFLLETLRAFEDFSA